MSELPENSSPGDALGGDAIRAWLGEVMRLTGLKATPLANEAGLSPSTLLRVLDPHSAATLGTRSITKIVARFGVPPPVLYSSRPASAPGGLREPDLETVSAASGLSPTQGQWTVRNRALELAGYMPGDQVVADSAIPARARDVVVAQIVDQTRGSAETVLRLYDPPYLLTETLDPDSRRRPLLVDGETVAIWGTVVRSWRERK